MRRIRRPYERTAAGPLSYLRRPERLRRRGRQERVLVREREDPVRGPVASARTGEAESVYVREVRQCFGRERTRINEFFTPARAAARCARSRRARLRRLWPDRRRPGGPARTSPWF